MGKVYTPKKKLLANHTNDFSRRYYFPAVDLLENYLFWFGKQQYTRLRTKINFPEQNPEHAPVRILVGI